MSRIKKLLLTTAFFSLIIFSTAAAARVCHDPIYGYYDCGWTQQATYPGDCGYVNYVVKERCYYTKHRHRHHHRAHHYCK